ncbi:SURF1 family protein [Cutibacterium equinum]|uniref:SURF1-like protein n=1 Tax=Cutibacterium equinum TaxID=3016342 RepID=A0ABY7QXN7_9ACTN|nr:SURF1 family protein [Cutibacterium equinum]WCC79287.1 SURF1 family protein [Cutibacterium equinum]
MKKLWVRWVAMTLLVMVLGLVMVRLGEWQLHRLSGRRETNEIIRTNENKPPVEWSTLMGEHPVTSQEQWRPVTITGSFDTAHELQVRYRSNSDDDGSEVLTPIVTEDGQHVLIDRGFLKRSSRNGDDQALPPPPSGTVTVTGRVKGNEHGKATATDPVQGKVRLINSEAIGKAQGITYVNGYISATSMVPAQTGLVPEELPHLDEGPHLSYAIQWFCFTAIALIGLFVLIRGDVKDRQKRRAKANRSSTPTETIDEPDSSASPKESQTTDARTSAT